ncbi:MAG: hypothetical protein GX660_14040, partial [Clostridiaceae bacterium]|nr:hypothetical protein [Clostridiaceae bacterium]
IMHGDINLDGKINSTDISLLKRYILGIDVNFTSDNFEAADVNHDGKVNSTDFSYLKRYVLELINVFPADQGDIIYRINSDFNGYNYYFNEKDINVNTGTLSKIIVSQGSSTEGQVYSFLTGDWHSTGTYASVPDGTGIASVNESSQDTLSSQGIVRELVVAHAKAAILAHLANVAGIDNESVSTDDFVMFAKGVEAGIDDNFCFGIGQFMGLRTYYENFYFTAGKLIVDCMSISFFNAAGAASAATALVADAVAVGSLAVAGVAACTGVGITVSAGAAGIAQTSVMASCIFTVTANICKIGLDNSYNKMQETKSKMSSSNMEGSNPTDIANATNSKTKYENAKELGRDANLGHTNLKVGTKEDLTTQSDLYKQSQLSYKEYIQNKMRADKCVASSKFTSNNLNGTKNTPSGKKSYGSNDAPYIENGSYKWCRAEKGTGVPGKENGGYIPRHADSEKKFFEYWRVQIYNKYGNANVEGKLDIHVRYEPCGSCLYAAEQFAIEFPNIKVTITWGGKYFP